MEVLTQRQLTKRPPFHEAGGPFTVYRCRLEAGGAEFFFADRVARGGGLLQGAAEALWVTTVKEGEAVLKAFRDAMPVSRRAKKRAKPVRVSPPTELKGVDLAGPGTLQRRKWNSLQNEAELLVEWDAAKTKGTFVEKDDLFREGVLNMIAGLLIRK
jgi:hypothetical protein